MQSNQLSPSTFAEFRGWAWHQVKPLGTGHPPVWGPASGKGHIFKEYPVPQALPEGNCNYLPHIPHNKFILLNLFFKDSIIFTIYFILVCIRILHSFQEKRGTNQSLNLIISGLDSNINIQKLTYDKKKNWKFVKHKDDTYFL